MKIEMKVPAMGESISEATIGTIMKPTGSKVAVDDEILELETDKVNQVLYAQQAGVVTLNVKAEEVVKIGQVIGTIDSAAAAETTHAPEESTKNEEKAKKVETLKATPEPKAASEQGKQIRKEEGAARVTKEAFIQELNKPQSNVRQAVEEKPKQQAAPSPASQPQPQPANERETRRKMSKVRKVIAERLVEVQHTTAMLTTFNEVDLTQIISLREKYKDSFAKQHGVKLGFMSFFVLAVVSALKSFPDFNSFISGDEIVHREYYDIGVAVGTDRGVFVPVIRNCDRLSFADVESAIENFARKAREGTIGADDLQGGGFTITNGGVYGSLLSTPILNPNQCGILGMHKIEKRPVVINDQVAIRSMMYLALSYDHRIADGKEAVSFLVDIKNKLEDPSRLFLQL